MLTQIIIPPPRGTVTSLSLLRLSKTLASLPSIAFPWLFFPKLYLIQKSIKNLAIKIEITEDKKPSSVF